MLAGKLPTWIETMLRRSNKKHGTTRTATEGLTTLNHLLPEQKMASRVSVNGTEAKTHVKAGERLEPII